jgi:hypothetical protein
VEEKLKLGKDAAFVEGRFKRLRQDDETWEADFRARAKPITQSQTHYRGMVVATANGRSYSPTWTNSASRSPSTGSFRRCSKPTGATCGSSETPTGSAW